MEEVITTIIIKMIQLIQESILTKQKTLKYKRLTDIVFLKNLMPKKLETARRPDIVIKAIIKYSLARIFFFFEIFSKSHYCLKKNLFLKNWKLLDTKTYNEEAIIFSTCIGSG